MKERGEIRHLEWGLWCMWVAWVELMGQYFLQQIHSNTISHLLLQFVRRVVLFMFSTCLNIYDDDEFNGRSI